MANTQIIKFSIVRETSQYNKYIKWFRRCFNNDGAMISSIGYKTEREARDFEKEKDFPIGDKITHYIYQEA